MNNQDNNSNNGGILSKFRQRLRNIRISRSKRLVNNDKFVQDKVEEIRDTIRNDMTPIYRKVPYKGVDETINKQDESISLVINNIRDTSKDRNYPRKKVIYEKEKKTLNVEKDKLPEKKELVEDNKELDKENINTVPRKHYKVSYVPNGDNPQIRNSSDIEKNDLVKELGIEIIDKIKSSFEDKIDELEVVMSELYLLEKTQENELELKKVKEIKERINEIIIKINEIIEQYNLYKGNYYIDNVIGIDDNTIVDDIIQYRELLDSFNNEKRFVKEYKALEEFNRLYSTLKVVKDDTEKLLQSNEDKIEEFEIRDKKYDSIKLGIIPIQEIDKNCSLEIERQNKYFADLMDKINKINTKEYTTTHMVGIDELVGQSLRYIGLLILSPLKGLIPGIAIETLQTKRMIKNIYNNLHYEDIKHIRYDTVNYDSELNHHLCSIDYTSNLLCDTLNDIKRLKEDFMLQYDSRISGYEDTLKNIQQIENRILHNQNRVEIVKKNLKKSKKVNEDKMILVKNMNKN